MRQSHPYVGRQASLATLHKKRHQVAPVFSEVAGIEVVETHVNTDVLGTFTGDVPRVGSPLETAVQKARLGMQASGLSLGLASEGTFGPHPVAPMLTVDTEILVLVDDELDIVVVESVSEVGIPVLGVDVDRVDVDDDVLRRGGFPEHGVIVRPSDSLFPIFKGIHHRDELTTAIKTCLEKSSESKARIESDLRAHHHPTRQQVIARVAHQLAQRLTQLCPQCDAPGWGRVRIESGAKCSQCGVNTSAPQSEIFGCPRCDHHDVRDVAPARGVDPARCPRCNP